MAVAARALGWLKQIIDATRAQMQSITKIQISNHGSHDGCVGGADQITEPAIDYAVEAQVLAKFQSDLQLAKYRCFPKGSDESLSALLAARGTVSEGPDRRDEFLDEGRQAPIFVIG